MLSKSKQAKGEILNTLDKIGTPLDEGELDLKSLGIYSNNGQIAFASESNNPVAKKSRTKIESMQPAKSGLIIPEGFDCEL
mmetsp:Transcript_36734/g.27195  ORF Transcript_36734/g.27195 Transcript_36734/m.27195 type:complete len:81 (+) Transcript_36734:371-613(+)